MERYIPYPFYYDDMPVDISFMFESERPAGKHGFMRANGDEFAFADGTPARFWGVNFNGGACFPDHAYSEKVARRLAKTGVNIVRFHQLDAEWNTPNIYNFTKGPRKGTRALDPVSMERLDYLVCCLKNEGIYCYLDMMTYRNFKSCDGVANAAALGDAADPYCYYDPKLIELQKEYMLQLWTHLNPYTKLEYRDDPVFVMTEIINERDFWSRARMSEIEPYAGDFRRIYAAWCAKNAPGADASVPDLNCDTDANLTRFKFELMLDYNNAMASYMRSLGVKIPITGTNMIVNGYTMLSCRDLDYTDAHPYYYDWSWGETVKRCMNRAVTQDFPTSLEGNLGMRDLARPFFVSEWDMPWPNEYRAESSVLFAAIGGLQGWSGFAIHTYAYGTRLDDMRILGKEVSSSSIGGVPYREGIFSTWNDPAKYGLFYHAAIITRRGDVKKSEDSVAVRIDDPVKRGAPRAALGLAEKLRCGVAFPGQPAYDSAVPQDDAIVAEADGEVASSTGELYRSWKKNFGTIDTPKTKCAYGFLGKNSPAEIKGLKVDCATDFAVIAASSLDDRDMSSSENILLTAVGRARNTDEKHIGDQLVDYGRPPVEIEVVDAVITIETSVPDLKIWSINAEGMCVGFVKGQYADGKLTFHIGNTMPSMYYLLQKE